MAEVLKILLPQIMLSLGNWIFIILQQPYIGNKKISPVRYEAYSDLLFWVV